MEIVKVGHRCLGISFNDTGASALVWAPKAMNVTLQNMTTGKNFDLEPQPYGYFYLDKVEVKAGDRYMFSLNGEKGIPDPASLSQPEGVHMASEAIDTGTFVWHDQHWRNLEFGSYIIYELHVGSFSIEGTFDGVISKLGYLKDLGINAIEIMPVAQFPGTRNWGYDGVFPFAAQNSYGGASGLQRLVDACHQQGFAVILDVVYNHMGPEGNYLNAYGPYFTDNYKTPWGSAVNCDAEYCDAVRDYFIENAMMWLRDFHFDALRLDAVHAIRDYSPNHFIKELNDEVRLLDQWASSPKYLIAETDLNDNIYIRSEEKGGYGIAAQWNDEFHHALRVCAGQEKTGYYIDYNGVADLAKSMEQAYVYTGQYSEFRRRKFGTSTEGISNDHFIVFDQNHDQVGNRMLGERLSQLVSFEMQKLLPAVVLTSPFIPLLFMGEEWGAGAPFPYFMDLSEPELIEGVSKGRKEEFKHFISQGEPMPAHEETTFLKTKLDWGKLAEKQHQQLFGYYKELISLRKRLDIFGNYDRKTVKVYCEEYKNVIVLKRKDREKEIICIYNFSKQLQVIEVGATLDFEILLYSADFQWGGQGYGDSDIQDGKVSIKPESAIVLLHSVAEASFVFYHQD